MNPILWLGESDHWQPAPAQQPRYLMPLIEEEVLNVALSTSPLRKLSLSAAINCTSRLAQRTALESTGLNPAWRPFDWSPGVIKAPASILNQGVRYLPSNDHVARLKAVAPALAAIGIVEDFIPGEEWEQDGWIVNGKLGFFYPLRQWWNEARTRILCYERACPPDGLQEAIAKAVQAVGLDNTPYCVELRYREGRWFVVEIHARLGEDEGLAEKMCDRDALEVIAEAC